MSFRRYAQASSLALVALASSIAAQAAPRPQPYCLRGVSLDRSGERRGTLVLRDGAIAAILDENAPAPAGTRVIEGQGLICLPAFLDAFSRQGCEVPQPVLDQDIPPDLQADVGVDMRLANRKGIQPAFGVIEALAIGKEQSEAWRKSGFGTILVAPGGQLLSGTSTLATVREAAMRDLVIRDQVFTHGAFVASGSGYPRTYMGYFAQLRQFFLDSKHQIDLADRYQQGRPGMRPPFDRQLAEGVKLIDGQQALMVEANDSKDIERWFRLGNEFGLKIGVAGGLQAWRLSDDLVSRATQLVLTLDWGKEVKDPRAKKNGDKSEEVEAKGGESKETENPKADAEEGEADDNVSAVEGEPVWTYEEPLAVRLRRRLDWEQGRDCALRLQEAGARFSFGTANSKPSELLEHVRDLVEVGLSPEVALEALTGTAAEMLGVADRLGRIEPGYDATIALWRKDPLTEKDASPAWVFVDGFASEFKEEKEKKKGGKGPEEGIDPSGTWQMEFVVDGEGIKTAQLTLEMDEDGSLSGILEVDNPMGGGMVSADIEGEVSGEMLDFECTLSFGEFVIETTIAGKINGDTLDGDGSFHGPWSEEPTTQVFKGRRGPKKGGV